MITVIYSTHRNSEYNSNFKEHLSKTIGIEDFQILEYQNNNEFSLSQIYNKGISESKFEIIVCCHNDIKLEKGWGKKLLKDFENNPEYSIIGKAGSCYFPESGVYWEKMHTTMVGQVYHHPQGKNKWLSKYSAKVPFLMPVVTVDGLFISFNRKKIKHIFDESIGKFHFYDHGFCVPNFLDGIKIGVTCSFDITHESVGQPNSEFWESKNKFVEKYSKFLPLEIGEVQIYIPQSKKINNKKTDKVAVIIPTKDKSEILLKCLESLFENCDSHLFDVFIADTGSEPEQIKNIENYTHSKTNIKLIKYDYYNFAKINNDVVKNHLTEDHHFLLFCNNDVILLNDVISEMIETFKTDNFVGTVGARLHYENGKVQHDGVGFYIKMSNSECFVQHLNKLSYFKFSTEKNQVFANTAALMMIRKKVFEKISMFNENYRQCFEDVDLCVKVASIGLKNIMNGKCVGIHNESQTRIIDDTASREMIEDFQNYLLPLIKKNFQKLQDKILALP